MVIMEQGPYVLAGYDGSDGAVRALRWAVEEARLRRRPLIVCHAWRWPYPEKPADEDVLRTVRLMGENVLERGVSRVHSQAPGLTVHSRLVTGAPTACLLNEAREAEVIVLGSHGSGGFPGLAAGSAALQVPAHAPCPVVIVHPFEIIRPRVVVGVDGSPSADAALGFGFEQAALRGWELQAVYGCWELPATADAYRSSRPDMEALKRTAGARLERAVSLWREKYPHVPAWTRLRLEEPRQALLSAAEQAGLLVVGDRGGGGLPGMRLGAVTEAMLRQASCPVAVVPSRHRD